MSETIRASTPNWEQLPGHQLLKGRAGHTTTLVGDRLFILCGRHQNHFFNDLWIFDTKVKKWHQIQKELPFCGRAYHTATLVDKKEIWLIGGNDNRTIFDDVYVLDIATFQWKNPVLKGSLEIRHRSTHSAVLHPFNNRSILVYGGYGSNNPQWLGDLSTLCTDSLEWNALSPGGIKPNARGYHSFTRMGTFAVLFGGKGDGGIIREDFLCVYDFRENKWFKRKPAGTVPQPRSNHAATQVNSDLVVIHGGRYQSLRLDDICVLQVTKSLSSSISNIKLKWEIFDNTIECNRNGKKRDYRNLSECPPARSAHSLIAKDQVLYLFGGYGGEGLSFSDIFVLHNFSEFIGTERQISASPRCDDANTWIFIEDNSDGENKQGWRNTKKPNQSSLERKGSLPSEEMLMQKVDSNLARPIKISKTTKHLSVSNGTEDAIIVKPVLPFKSYEDDAFLQLEEERDLLKKEVAILKDKVTFLEADMKDKNFKQQELIGTQKSLDKEVVCLKETNGDLLKVIQLLEKKVEISNVKCKEFEDELLKLQSVNQKLKSCIEEKKMEIKEVLDQAKDIQQENKDLKVSLHNAESFSKDLVGERDNYRTCVERLEKKLQEQMQTLEQITDRFNNEKKFLITEVTERKETTDRLLTELGASKESIKSLHDTFNKQAKQLEDEIGKSNLLQKEKEELTHKNSELVAENNQMLAAREDANANLDFLRCEFLSIRTLYEKNVAEMSLLQKDMYHSKEETLMVKDLLKKMEDDCQRKDQELASLRELVDEVQKFEEAQVSALQNQLEKVKLARKSYPA